MAVRGASSTAHIEHREPTELAHRGASSSSISTLRWAKKAESLPVNDTDRSTEST